MTSLMLGQIISSSKISLVHEQCQGADLLYISLENFRYFVFGRLEGPCFNLKQR